MRNPADEIKKALEQTVQREIQRPDLMQKYNSSGLPMPTPQQQRAPVQRLPQAGVGDVQPEEGGSPYDPGQPNFFGIASLENELFPANKEGGLLTPEEQLGMPEFERKLWGAVDKRGKPKDTLGIARFEEGLWPRGWEY